MGIKTANSSKQTVDAIVTDLQSQFQGISPKLIVLFASSAIDQDKLINQMKSTFAEAEIIGCSTAGEITSGKMMKGSAVAMALNTDVVEDLKVEVLHGISENSSARTAMDAFEAHYGESAHAMDIKKYVGLVLMDGLSGSEEQIMDSIGDSTNITFIGGSAGDDLKFQNTYVYVDGKAHTDSAVLVLMKLKKGFDIVKTQSFNALDKTLKVTKVSEKDRQVFEFNNMPAVDAYAQAIGVASHEVDTHFMSNPVGVVIDENDIFVRSPQRSKDGSIIFYCGIPDGMSVSLLESTDIIGDTRNALAAKVEEMGGISGIINFNCILRTLELEQEGNTEAYGDLFKDIPTVGFSTYGEAYIGHINQTATMLLLK